MVIVKLGLLRPGTGIIIANCKYETNVHVYELNTENIT